MTGFHRRDGRLLAENVAVETIAAEVGTPVYVYCASAMEERFSRLSAALPPRSLIAFAVKANPNLGVIATLARVGCGADVVSQGELARARRAGVAADHIVFSGVGKTEAELEAALRVGIRQLNVESEPELHMLSAIANRTGYVAPIALRVNPDVKAGGHAKISTGGAEHKFGIPAAQIGAAAALAASLPGLRLQGLAVHIGSQQTQLGPMQEAFTALGTLARELRAEGHAMKTIDLGGGLGVPYEPGQPAPPAIEEYGAMVARVTRDWDASLIFEPGRALVAEAGALIARVILVKEGQDRRFVVVDAAMNDLMRPTLYGAYHDIQALTDRPERMTADVVGPACETGDTFARQRDMAAVGAGELVALMTAGAYGATMASTYNSRPLVAEVLVRGGEWRVVANRVMPEQMMALETVPEWSA